MARIGPQQLERLLAEHGGPLVLLARQWSTMPEDVVQEAMLALVRQEPPPENPVGWVYRVVRNRAISSARRASRRARHEQTASFRGEPWFRPNEGQGIVRVEAPVQQTVPQASPPAFPEQLPGVATSAPEVETAIASASDSHYHKTLPTNPNSAFGMLASVFSKRNRLSNKSAFDRRQPSYRELRKQILAKGIESWPVSKSGRTQSKNTDPISRLDWTKALLANED